MEFALSILLFKLGFSIDGLLLVVV